MRGRKNISAATRKKVHDMAAQLGYTTDAHLSGLMSYLRRRQSVPHRGTLVWINSSASSRLWHTQPYKTGFFEGAQRRARTLGYEFDEVWTGDPDLSRRRLGQILETRRVDGLIIPTLKWTGDDKLELPWDNYAAAYIDTTILAPALSCVSPDYGENLRRALHAVLELGYVRVGCWLSSFVDDVAANRYSGMYLYERAHRRLPMIPIPELETDRGQRFGAWVREYRPDAIICNEATCMTDLQKLGLRVPQDVALVHLNVCGDVAGWAGIDQKHAQLGECAVDMVVAQLHRDERGIPSLVKHIDIRGGWVMGWTCPDHASLG